jgi:LysM repeat protein
MKIKMSDDQAKNLRISLQENMEDPEREQQHIDVLKLPPRSANMKDKEEKNRPWWKLKYPLIRFLVVLFILLPGMFLYYIYHKSGELVINHDGLKVPSKKFEKVFVSNSNEGSSEESKVLIKKPENDKEQIKNIEKSNGNTQVRPRFKVHIVQPGETLYSITMKYYKTRDGEELIREQNHIGTNEVIIGQKLEIPMNEELIK